MTAAHDRAMRRAAAASVAVSLGLLVLKTVAYLASGSVAVLASLADSALDLFTAGLNLFAIRLALNPPDAEHRFGHGKAEPLAGLAQGAFISASAMFLVLQAVERLRVPQPIAHSQVVLAVMGVSILAVTALIVYERRVARRTGSLAIAADALHYVGDLATNIGVVAAVGLASAFGWMRADPLVALLVAAVLAGSAFMVIRASFDQLMDRELSDAERARIAAVMRGNAAVKAVHDLKTRKAGRTVFVQAHIELDGTMPLFQAHAVSDRVEAALRAVYPEAQIILHQDPAGLEGPCAP